MTRDARFEEGGEAPLRLKALDADDLQIVSAFVQDAVFLRRDVRWNPRQRRFALLVNRFRWEDRERAERAGGEFERVRSVLSVEDALRVRASGLEEVDADTVLSLLSLSWTAGEDGTGTVDLTLAGDGAIRVEVEALEVLLRDVTRPYRAPSRRAPLHA
jgi:Protein of unknown function (DUF2948)